MTSLSLLAVSPLRSICVAIEVDLVPLACEDEGDNAAIYGLLHVFGLWRSLAVSHEPSLVVYAIRTL